MLSYRKEHVGAALALMTALGCGHSVSNPNESDGPTSATGAGASTASATTQSVTTDAVTATSATAGTTSTSGGSGNQDCKLPNAEDLAIDNPLSESEVLFNDVLADHLERLYESVGQYASGATAVFRGQLQGLEDRTATGSTEILTLSTTRAVASLKYDDGLAGAPIAAGYALTAFDPDTRRVVRLIQAANDPNPTYVSPIAPFFSRGGIHASCSDCLVELAGVQDEISFVLSAHGNYGDADGTPMQVDAEGHFSRVPVEAITLEDILTLSSVWGSDFFQVEPRMDGDYAVFDISDSEATGQADENGCNSTLYSIEWYVRESCLADYGVRNLVIDDSPRECSQDG